MCHYDTFIYVNASIYPIVIYMVEQEYIPNWKIKEYNCIFHAKLHGGFILATMADLTPFVHLYTATIPTFVDLS